MVTDNITKDVIENDMLIHMSQMLEFLKKKMEMLRDVSLENEEYNNLYMAMKALNEDVYVVLKAQYEVDKKSGLVSAPEAARSENQEEPSSL